MGPGSSRQGKNTGTGCQESKALSQSSRDKLKRIWYQSNVYVRHSIAAARRPLRLSRTGAPATVTHNIHLLKS
jgi:hypothetical protein